MVKGGVLIAHQINDGKHQYQVENVLKYKKASGEKWFVRYDFKLLLQSFLSDKHRLM